MVIVGRIECSASSNRIVRRTPAQTALTLVEAHDIGPTDTEETVAQASRGAAAALHHETPSTGLEAELSTEHPVTSEGS